MSQDELNEALVRAQRTAENLARSLPDRIPMMALPLSSKIPLKVLTLRESLLHRASALASPAVVLFQDGNDIGGILLTRALMETVAIMADLDVELSKFLNDKHENLFDKFLMNLLFANRNGKGELVKHLTKSIMYSIDRLDKKVKGIRFSYDALSEYCHPNWSGVHGSFTSINAEKRALTLGAAAGGNGFIIGTSALAGSLDILVGIYNEMPKSLLALNRHFEPDWKEG